MLSTPLSLSLIFLSLTSFSLQPVYALGKSCSGPITSGTAAPGDPYWLQNIQHQGIAAFNPNPEEYQVFRNVKDFGAVGDGVTDDTAAINSAISTGNRCGGGRAFCNSTTVSPAVVYFPRGTYLVSAPVIAYYYTQLIGDALVDANPYIEGGQFYASTDNFFRSVRNFIIDTRRIPAAIAGTGIHWQVSQSTSLMNLVFELNAENGTNHQGLFMEDGSGGYMGDLVFKGGKYGIWGGNQQFTVRNISVSNAEAAFFGAWNWGWTFQGVTISDCQVGFDLTTGGLTQATQTVGAEAIIDAVVQNTPIFIRTSKPSNGSLVGSLVINNARLTNVPIAVGVLNGGTVLSGKADDTMVIESWAQGNVYSGLNPSGTFVQGDIPSASIPRALLDSAGRIVGKMHPQYENYAVDQFVSVRNLGAKGDGKTDDTEALQKIFDEFSGCKIIFVDAGTYVITKTLTIPAGTQLVGEAWSVIAGKGEAFSDKDKPEVVVRVGEKDSQGVMEISDILFSTIGPAPGAIVVEWNVRQPDDQPAGAGMWDSHIRLGGAVGTNLEANCPRGQSFVETGSDCFAAFLALHLTPGSSAYLEGTWVWLADHDIDGHGSTQRITIYSGRGILSESAGPVWMIGTGSEHHVLYQYQLVNAANHWMGLIQTETPYYQPIPPAPLPFSLNNDFKDPLFLDAGRAWGVRIAKSNDIIVFGAGLYSFFLSDSQECIDTTTCQAQIFTIDDESSVRVFSLSTVGTTMQLSVDALPIIMSSMNINGFASTVTAWSP
ncbi:exo-beta-1,3-glucanase [Dendrothele bispora CBS 962.96]|uniref:Exo-beta-1,3-glucanase n=1 Tax=Dendrothele bispora (strain CBS 962.96) TaxID=1314807 RepID=A0A4S8MV54_DENBC|nr:exo-beta-1,3-glucanase [Dendrothele bispora CBS 962.96]